MPYLAGGLASLTKQVTAYIRMQHLVFRLGRTPGFLELPRGGPSVGVIRKLPQLRVTLHFEHGIGGVATGKLEHSAAGVLSKVLRRDPVSMSRPQVSVMDACPEDRAGGLQGQQGDG